MARTTNDSKKRRSGVSSHSKLKKSKKPDFKATKIKRAFRPRKNLAIRGGATALGIRVVKSQLRTINAHLRKDLLSKSPPFGFGELSKPLDRESELLDCLYEMREMLSTLSFHLGLDDVTELPTWVPITPDPGKWSCDDEEYRELLSTSGKEVGKVSLMGLVNRFSDAIFSDHHGLLINAKINTKPDLNIYYHSLDATNNFSGGSAVRSHGSMLPFTFPLPESESSLRGAVGFEQQLFKLLLAEPLINVIVLAEVGQKDTLALVKRALNTHEWTMMTTNPDKKSNVNDITFLYKSELSRDYEFLTRKLDIGNCAVITSNKNTPEECILIGSHILNKKAKNNTVAEFMAKTGVAAIFGDTNLSTKAASSLKLHFESIESQSSVTDSLTLSSSNSASDIMFDKLLVRMKQLKVLGTHHF